MATDLLTDDPEVLTDDQEVVPAPPRLPDFFEVVGGEIVEVPPMSFYANEVANLLKEAIDRHLAARPAGRCRIELLFAIPLPEDRTRNRQPDLAFISYDRWPRDRPLPLTGSALNVVPDLAVEVVSPTDFAEDVQAKAREYVRGGVRLVWQIYPRLRELHASDGTQAIRVYAAADDIDGGAVLPGFAVRLADLFPPVAPAEGNGP